MNAHIVLTTGGTGGHLFPAQALARALLTRGYRVSLITDLRGGNFGQGENFGVADIKTWPLNTHKMTGGNILHKLTSVVRLLQATYKARQILKSESADLVVGFGSYASVPAAWAAGQLGLPLVLHEQNAVAGRANRLLSKRAQVICTSFATVDKLPTVVRTVMTGNPVREDFIGLEPRRDFHPPLRLLVTGGSQGASLFNSLVPAALCQLPECLRDNLHVAQQLRGDHGDEVRTQYAAAGISCDLRPFFDDLATQMQKTHLMICRAGASTVAELAVAGVPAILIPYPHAADDHQRANAERFARAGGGWVMPQQGLSAEKLSAKIRTALEDQHSLQQAAKSAAAFACPNAVTSLADVICAQLKRKTTG